MTINIDNVNAVRHDANVIEKLRTALKGVHGLSPDLHSEIIESCRAVGLFPMASYSSSEMHASANAADVETALASIPGFAAPLRRAVVEALAAKGIGKVSATSGDRRTPNSIMASSPKSAPMLRQLRAELARVGFDLQDDEPVNLIELNAAIKASGDVSKGWFLKSACAQLGLIN
jgi:copper chaperone CopZ